MTRAFVTFIGVLFYLESQAQTRFVLVPSGAYLPFFPETKVKTSKDQSKREPVQIRAFWMDRFAVTNAEYLEFVKKNPSWRKSRIKSVFSDAHYLDHWRSDFDFGNPAQRSSPVTHISWFAATAYCEWKGEKLPSVDQWEYAASEGGRERTTDANAQILEWYSKPSSALLPSVFESTANKLGVHGLLGLVWEWNEDFNSAMASDESRDGGQDGNLFCGNGSQGALDPSDYATFMRYAFRNSLKANYTTANLGFRCVKEVTE